MYIFRMAYRHSNGEVEGFCGCGSSQAAAERDAERKVRSKCLALDQIYDRNRRIDSVRGVDKAEMEIIRADWKVSERSSDQ